MTKPTPTAHKLTRKGAREVVRNAVACMIQDCLEDLHVRAWMDFKDWDEDQPFDEKTRERIRKEMKAMRDRLLGFAFDESDI